MWHVYVLQSKKLKRFYIGVTENLISRLSAHNNGETKSTKPYKPWVIIYNETYLNKKEAYKREWYLKHPNGYQDKLIIINKYGKTGGIA